MSSPGLITICCLLALVPLAAIADWLHFLDSHQGLEEPLAKAAHGVGIIVCGGYVLWLLCDSRLLTPEYRTYACWAYGGIGALGTFWLLIGAARAQIYGDRRLLTRAVMKMAMGFVILYGWRHYRREIDFVALLDSIAPLPVLWCWATGFTKLLICLRPMRRLLAGETGDVYGTANFRGASGLRGQRKPPD
jgi:hypothetical protein